MRNTLTVSTLHINFILNFYINRKRQEDWATIVNHCCWPLGPDKFPSPSRDNTINHPHKLFIWRKLYKIADGQQPGFMDVLLFGGFHLENKTLWLAVGGNVGIPLEVVTITAPLTLIIWSRAQHLVITSYTRTHTNNLTSTCTVDRQIRSVEVSDGPMSGFGSVLLGPRKNRHLNFHFRPPS